MGCGEELQLSLEYGREQLKGFNQEIPMAAGWRLAWPGKRGSGESLQAIAIVQDGEHGGLH